jgi:hypothetical protein
MNEIIGGVVKPYVRIWPSATSQGNPLKSVLERRPVVCQFSCTTEWTRSRRRLSYAGRLDGFHAVPASISKTCLARFDNNKYAVTAWFS